MRKFALVALSITVLFTACKESFQKGEKGMEYKVIKSGSGEKTFEVPQGFVVVDSNVVTIVVDDSGEGELHLEELDD